MLTGRDESKVRGERLLTISGNTEQRIEAAGKIISKIAADPDNMANTTLKYSRGSHENRDNYSGNDGGNNMFNQNNGGGLPHENPLAALGLGGGANASGLGVLAEVAQQLVGGLSQVNTSNSPNNIKTTVQ